MARPNVLWILSDQHNANCFGFAGHPDVRTPNLDALAASGVQFTRAYCSNPLCGPARASLLTGQYPHTHGILGNSLYDVPGEGYQDIGTHFRKAGYQTAVAGKAHMPKAWRDRGFEVQHLCDLGDAEPDNPLSVGYFRYLVERGLGDAFDLAILPPGHPGAGMRRFISDIPLAHSVELWTAERMIDFLQTRDKDRPFLAQLSFQRPHDPLAPSPEVAKMYDPATLTLPANAVDFFQRRFAGKPAFQQRYIAQERGSGYPYRPIDEADLRGQLAAYYTLITVIDQQIGRVLATLRETGVDEETIVVYQSDHGDFAGEHGLILKNLGIYEAVHRIGLIAQWPNGPQGETRQDLAEGVDIYPTLCALAGLDVPTGVEGRALLPTMPRKLPATFCEYDFHTTEQASVVAVRTERYRLVYYLNQPDDGELYDLQEDPGELENLYRHEAARSVRLDLIQQALSHVGRYRRTVRVKNAGAASQRTTRFTDLIHRFGVKWSEVARFFPDASKSGKQP